MKWLKSLFGISDQPRARSKASHRNKKAGLRFEPGGLKAMGDIPRYPPFTEGLPAATPDELLATQESLIRQLKHELALPPAEEKRLVYPLLHSYASFVHLLPASKAHHHRGAGGMLRHGLEVALWSARGFHGKIVDGHESGERRKVLEPRWRLAVAVAGLCHDIGKTAYDVVVTDATGKKTWDVYDSLLAEWIEAERLDRYFINWRSGREHKVHERFGHLLTMRVIPREVLSYLNEADPKIIAVMHETIAGQIPKGSAKVVYELVMQADQRSVQRDIKGQRIADSDAALGVPVAKYLVDAMKRLIDDGKWKANEQGQPLWVGGNGVYIDWEMAVPQITGLLEKDGIAGIPRSENSVAESLSDFDVLKKQVTPEGVESYYLPVAPEKLCSKKKVHEFRAVEVSGLDILFDGPQPAPIELHIGAGAIHAREELNNKREQKLAKARNERALQRHEEKVADMDGQSRPVLPSESTTDDNQAPTPAPSIPAPAEADFDALEEAIHESSRIQSQAPAPADEAEPDTPAAKAEQWLEGLTAEQREVIRACCVPSCCQHAHIDGDDVVVKYPDALSAYGDERNAKLELIKPLLEPHPTVPGKPTHKRKLRGKETNVLVFQGDIAAHLCSLAPEAVPAVDDAGEPKSETAPAKKPASKPKPAAKKPKAQTPPREKEPATDQPAAQDPKAPPAKQAKAAAPKKKPTPQTPKRPAAQKPPTPSSTPDNTPVMVEIKEKAISAYPNQRIEDSANGGVWVSAPDFARWFVESARPDMTLVPVMSAMFRIQKQNNLPPPNGDQDLVFIKWNS